MLKILGCFNETVKSDRKATLAWAADMIER